ncbi:MAG: cytochrome C [Desulfuromonas sp.]|nr:MAG: cytochrome C [Desulfuromonas sp.]
MKLKLFLFAIVMTLLASTSWAGGGLAIDPNACLECHEDSVATDNYIKSVHGGNACTSCHVEITDLDLHAEGEIEISPVDCSRCHNQQSHAYTGSVHAENEVGCTGCHTEYHAITTWNGNKNQIVQTCAECHDTDDYQTSAHGQAVAAGNNDAPVCSDCHSLHDAASLSAMSAAELSQFSADSCISCHDDEETMAANGVNIHSVETYRESYHGKNYTLGFPEQSAVCADCHGAHGVLPQSDSASTLHGENLVETCAQCHPNATVQFTKFYAHGDHSDSENYPILYWTFFAMTGLLIGTFTVFWIHTLLWMFRGFVENRENMKALAQGHVQHDIKDAHKPYRRFQRRHIFLHLTVIISFLGLSLTGLPLKFSDQQWARTMMDFYGGVHYAGLIHRGCAVLTFYYFVGSILLSIDFLFLRKDIKGNWLQRMFGPDSLIPNIWDIIDVTRMIKWFLFRGPKPTFDRWTYWEKFDFIAVFWGMFAIGGSGLMLWFPEIFGQILPGWAFNIATIVHSDEALLATGFIFTVHFFNTHGRPEKFPMDFVIFNGEISKEEFIEERGRQWERYEQMGITEEFAMKKTSGVIYDFVFKGFGFLAVFTGLALAALMLFAFIGGGGH